jgi:hypothetical protein
MKEWLPTIVALAGAVGSLVVLFFSLRVKRDADDSVKEAMKPFLVTVKKIQADVEKAEDVAEKAQHDLSKAFTQIAGQKGECMQEFVRMGEWERMEKQKDRYMSRIEEQNSRLEKSLQQVIRYAKTNGST